MIHLRPLLVGVPDTTQRIDMLLRGSVSGNLGCKLKSSSYIMILRLFFYFYLSVSIIIVLQGIPSAVSESSPLSTSHVQTCVEGLTLLTMTRNKRGRCQDEPFELNRPWGCRARPHPDLAFKWLSFRWSHPWSHLWKSAS